MKDHDRWLLARRLLEGGLAGRRASSRLPALVDFILARPIASAGMIASALGVTPRAAQDMVAEFGLREITGRGRYRAWGSPYERRSLLFLLRQPRRPIGGGEGEAKADAFERQVAAGGDGLRLARPGAVFVAAEKLGADRGRLEDKDLPHAGDGRVGPDIGPGFGLIAWREDFDQEGRVRESAFLGVVAGAGDGEVGDADVRLRLNVGDHAGRCDRRGTGRIRSSKMVER